ncbi:tyrosine-type recombinase/integrase [Bulleidia sp. zg-1006]|nr:tyrosine-type recombinase/integrase [Bulleidia sp. zg-1006]
MIESVFKKAISESGVQKIRVYDLRHSHDTWLISEGINIVAVSKRLGHATIEQTLKTYTHLSRNSEEQLIKKINEYNNEYKN